MKTCTKCGETKPIEAFTRDRYGLDGYETQCKDCINARRRARTAADPQRTARREEGRRRREEYERLLTEVRSNVASTGDNREDPASYPIKLAIFERRLALMDLRGVDEIHEGLWTYDRQIVTETIEWLEAEMGRRAAREGSSEGRVDRDPVHRHGDPSKLPAVR